MFLFKLTVKKIKEYSTPKQILNYMKTATFEELNMENRTRVSKNYSGEYQHDMAINIIDTEGRSFICHIFNNTTPSIAFSNGSGIIITSAYDNKGYIKNIAYAFDGNNYATFNLDY